MFIAEILPQKIMDKSPICKRRTAAGYMEAEPRARTNPEFFDDLGAIISNAVTKLILRKCPF